LTLNSYFRNDLDETFEFSESIDLEALNFSLAGGSNTGQFFYIAALG